MILAYIEHLKQLASEDYDTQLIIWSQLAAAGRSKDKRPPKIPKILESK